MGILDGLINITGRDGDHQPDRSGGGGGMSPMVVALLGLLAVKGFQNRDKLGEMLGQATGGVNANPADRLNPSGQHQGTQHAEQGGLGGMLGGLLGGAASGGALSGGLGELLERFKQTGHGDEADSWVRSGENKAVTPQHLESALDPQTIDALSKQTGLSREELMDRLATVLPKAVDTLTPDGRIPTQDEASRWKF